MDRSVPRAARGAVRADADVRADVRLATEEAEAIGRTEQRISVEIDAQAVAIMHDAQGEEFKHFSMDLELLLRRTPKWREIAKGVLFQDGDIVEHGESAEAAADSDTRVTPAAGGAAAASGSLGIGGMRGGGL